MSNCPKKCEWCKGFYKEVLEETNKIEDKQLRKNLIEVWHTLWLNNCTDFDVIAHTLEVKNGEKK